MSAPPLPNDVDIPGAVRIEIAVPVAAEHGLAMARLTDWPRQHEWMLGTRVTVSRGSGKAVGDELRAVTGVGRLGLIDVMEIAAIEPDWVVVRKTGQLGGYGWLGVPQRAGVNTLVWGGSWVLPFGRAGRAAWRIAEPAIRWGLARSLTRLAEQVEAATNAR